MVLLNLILFKAADSSREIYEVAMQLLQVSANAICTLGKAAWPWLTENVSNLTDPGAKALPLCPQTGDPADGQHPDATIAFASPLLCVVLPAV